MTIKEIYDKIGTIAQSKIGVESYHQADPYSALNVHEVKYGAVCAAVEYAQDVENIRTYSVILYYADRLVEGGYNKVQAQDDGINILSDIVATIRHDEDVIDVVTSITYTPFAQKFADYLAGAYCTIQITVPNNNCVMYDEF